MKRVLSLLLGCLFAFSACAKPSGQEPSERMEGLVLNEVSPAKSLVAESWIEIYNPGESIVPLKGLQILLSSDVCTGECIATLGSGAIASGGRYVVSSENIEFSRPILRSTMKEISIADPEGAIMSSFSTVYDLKTSGVPEDGGSYARIPDVTGSWTVTETATRLEENKKVVPLELRDIVFNEVCPEQGWVEIVNAGSAPKNIDYSTLQTADGKVLFTAPYSTTLKPGEHYVIDCGDASLDELCYVSNNGSRAAGFSSKFLSAPAKGGSWSRLPDVEGRWRLVDKATKGTENEGELPSGGITEGNSVAIWVPQSLTNSLDLQKMADLGIGNIILHEYAFRNFGKAKVESLVSQANELGIKIHIWLQCFWWNDDIQWRSPVVDPKNGVPAHYDQAQFDDILSRAKEYMSSGVHGIHFDYIRFGGTAAKHNFPEDGVTGIGAITEFCRQANQTLKAINPDIILSAALMGETGGIAAYGQDPSQMGQYLDVLIPMAYISSYGYSPSRNIEVANWFKDRSGKAKVWHGISTYDSSTRGLSADEIFDDCQNITLSRADGVALFRFGLGILPDLRGLY